MVVSLVRAIVFLWLMSVCAQVGAQALWRDSRVGQSVEEVRAAFPDALDAESPGRLHSGALGMLVIPDVAVANLLMDANFYFLNGDLSQVTLQLPMDATSVAAHSNYTTLREALRAKYGQELGEDVSSAIGLTKSSTWMSGPTNITLFLSTVRGAPPILSVIYQVRLSEAGSNL